MKRRLAVKRRHISWMPSFWAVCVSGFFLLPVRAAAQSEKITLLVQRYESYQESLEAIETV